MIIFSYFVLLATHKKGKNMIKIKNWGKFQHFKDRSPPWIKLYRENLYRRDIMSLSSCNFKLLVCLWMMASEDETKQGIIPPISDIAYTLRQKEEDIIKGLQGLKEFLIYSDDNMISARYQNDSPETETETETETELGETPKTPKTKKSSQRLTGTRLPPDWECSVELGTWAMTDYGMSREDVAQEIYAFKDYWNAKTGANAIKLDWDATFRNWIRNNAKWSKK